MSDPKHSPAPSAPDFEAQAESMVLGKDLSGLKSPEAIDAVVEVLKDPSASFSGSLKKLEKFIDETLKLPAAEKEKVRREAVGMVYKALEKNRNKIEDKKHELDEKLKIKKAELEAEPEVKKMLEEEVVSLKGEVKLAKIRELKAKYIDGNIAETPTGKASAALGRLLEILENPGEKLEKILSHKEEKHDAHAPAAHGADKHGHDAHTPAAPAHGADKHGHDAHAPASAAHGADKHDAHAAPAHAPAAHGAEKHDEHKAPAATAEEPKDFHAKNVADFEKPEDISNAQTKWKTVVNDLGKKPKTGDELFWQTKDGEVEAISDTKATDQYWKFQEFMKTSGALEEELQKKVIAVKIDAKGKDAATLEEEVDDKAQQVLKELLTGLSKNRQALLYHAMGVLNKARAFEKIKNIIKLQIVPNVRKGKNTYEEERGDDGKVRTVDLKKFLEDHKPYGERMLANSQEVVMKLHKKFGSKVGDLNTFRDVLIQVVKSKGSKSVGSVSEAEAKAIYTGYLTSLDAHAGEKEVLALLISFKENPPYVFDLINTTEGWELGTKKKINILEDFVLDGAMYQELMAKNGLASKDFNAFIRKVAPKYERIRSHLRGKIDKKEEVKLKELNDALGTELSDADLKHFQKLMTLPLWASKVGQAYKHAVYLDDEVDRKVPLMRDIQGPDTVKELNVLFVNVEEKLRRIAERLADERLDQELKEVGPQGWTQLWRLDKIAIKYWKRNAAEGYRQRYTEEFIRRLKEEPRFRTELMELPRDEVKPGYVPKLSGRTPAEGTRANISAELDAIATRFGISWTTGDTESYLTPNERTLENVANIAIQDAIRNLCRAYADGAINDAEFQNQVRTNIIPQIQALQSPPDASILAFLEDTTGAAGVDINKTGLLDRMRAHRAGLIALDLDNMRINIGLGRAQNVDVKTQVKSLNWTDRLSRSLVETVQRNRFLNKFISPTTVAVVGYGLSNIAAQWTTGTLGRYGTLATFGLLAPTMWPAVAGIAAGTLVGTAFSTLRQNKESLRLKAMKERRQALGYAPTDDRKGLRPNQAHNTRFERRLENENALYNKVPVGTLINNITGAADYNTLQHALAHAITLNEISEMGLPAEGGRAAQPTRIDLISFPNETNIEAERLRLLRTIAAARLRLRTLGAGRDVNTEMQHALATERAAVATQMRTSETNFQRIKRLENYKAAGIGAIFGAAASSIGLLFPHTNVDTQRFSLTPTGPLDQAALQHNLATVGYTPAQIADIQAHMVFDPATNTLTPASTQYLSNTYHMYVTGNHVPGTVTQNIIDLHSSTKMSQADLLSELSARGINTSSVTFDSTGHLSPASIAYLKGQNVDIQEVVNKITVPGGMNSTGTAPSGWEKLAKIHFNDNQPHAPNQHILDELHFWWNGKPQVGTDGNIHFTAKGMFDPKLGHSHLPKGVSMPTDGTQLKVGLQVKINGVNHWKFFTPDSNGDISMPPEYFDAGSLGRVARGGDTLPGLKTHALAVGFEDKDGVYQVLASVKGNASYTPNPTPISKETVEFLGKLTESKSTPGSDTFTVLRDVTRTVEYRAATPPIIPGAPMVHLEYGKPGPAPAAVAAPAPSTYPGTYPPVIKTTTILSGAPAYYGADLSTIVAEMEDKSLIALEPYKKVKKVVEYKNSAGDLISSTETELVDKSGNPIERTVDSERKAVGEYLNKLKPEETTRLDDLVTKIPPMDANCRVAVNIPAYHEEKNIYHTLEEYTQQVGSDKSPLDPSTYEINVIVNREASGSDDNTAAEIERFKTAHPQYRVNLLNVVFPDGQGGVGAARKVVTDLTLKRSLNRTSQTKPLFIETEDADLIRVDKKTVTNILEKMDNNPQIDAVRGVQDRAPEILMQNDHFFLRRRAFDFIESLIRQKKYRVGGKSPQNFTWNRVVTGGWNTAYSAEVYAKIDGYDPKMKMGEDMYIGQKISILRGDTNSSGEIVPQTETVETVATRTDSSPRRFLLMFAKNVGPYDKFGDEETEKAVRSKTNAELLNDIKAFETITMANKGSFEDNLTGNRKFLEETLPTPKDVAREFDRMMFFLGFKKTDYQVLPDGKVEISSLDNVKKALDEYKANPKYLKRKK